MTTQVYFLLLTQIKPVPLTVDDAIAGCKIVVRVLGCSMVSSVIKDTNSFIVNLSQSAL